MTGAQLLDAVVAVLRHRLPEGVTPAYFEGFLRRNREQLVTLFDRQLSAYHQRRPLAASQASAAAQVRAGDPRTVRERTEANLHAMQIVASAGGRVLTPAERDQVARYSGWGGLSIRKVIEQGLFPKGFPVPEARGLIHEFYTPSVVARELARVMQGMVEGLVDLAGGRRLRALEPAAGIGRFIHAFQALGLPLDWTAVEYSPVSSRLLKGLCPDATVLAGPFERHATRLAGGEPFDLVVSNPPYGERGEAKVEDPDPAYNSRWPHIYFMLRTADMLRAGGVGVYLIPHGFMDGTAPAMVAARERLLRSHHLITALRLPSEAPGEKDPIFPGASLVSDLIFWRRRPAPLAQELEDDRAVREGTFFQFNPHLILGEERRNTEERRYRSGYAVVGAFTHLPRLDERPMADGQAAAPPAPTSRTIKVLGGITRLTDEDTSSLPAAVQDAVALGWRVDTFLAQVARGDTSRALQAWAELHNDLTTWARTHGSPHAHAGLRELVAQQHSPGAERFLSVWDRRGHLLPALDKPHHEPRYEGEPTLLGQADWLYRQKGELSVEQLRAAFRATSRTDVAPDEIVATLTRAGWCLDGDTFDHLVPGEVYLTGDLWPRVDRCRARAADTPQAADQLARLMATIKPAVFEDLVEGLTPRESWLPVDVVGEWLNAAGLARGDGDTLLSFERANGVLQVRGLRHEDLSRGDLGAYSSNVTERLVWFLGWANHHLALFMPPQHTEFVEGERRKRNIDDVRLEISGEWTRAWIEWLREHPAAQARVEAAYNRNLRGYIAPTHSSDPIHIARWREDAPKLFDYQAAAARRILTNRSGLLAFDVGLGKTYTGIAILARARQEGWVRRPVVVVPNSIIWKWYRDFQRVLPDYRVLVIGSNRKVLKSGPRKGRLVSETDTPEERAQKWNTFQAGGADVVLLTYSALGRTRVDAGMLETYAEGVSAIQRTLQIQRQRAREAQRGDKELTERQQAVLEEGIRGWLAEHLKPPKNQPFDPGIEWHRLGIDFLMVDEAQNFKNLFMPEEREGGIPDAMGGTEESKRAWQLDFRCASVRAHTGGTGIVLLSATPAKNGPVEFYNAIHLIRPKAWESVGISDPETFIDRYCSFEKRQIQTSEGKIATKLACVAFRNLHELRDVVFRYADFKTAEDVGLKIPEASATQHMVDLGADQIEAIKRLWSEVTDLRDQLKRNKDNRSLAEAIRLKIQGLGMKVDLVAIHESLAGAADMAAEERAKVNPHSGKIDAVVAQIVATAERACDKRRGEEFCLNCGHIVFCEFVAAHEWLKRALVEAGIPAERIAILNADVAKDAETRQQIAEAFNGVGRPGDEEYDPPAYDVVIANSVAYEGVDLQRRTCAIHHVDLPWEPATLQQRNGRGVRQGNHFEAVRLHYYLGKPSGDGRRLSKIQNKRGWMMSLVKSQDRVTNNPAAAVEMSVEDLMLDIAPPEERARVLREREEAQKKLQEQANQRVRKDANRMLKQANARFRRAEQTHDPAESARLRQEGEALLADLARLNQAAWPWLALALKVRELDLYVPEEGPAVYPGLTLRAGSTVYQIGRAGKDRAGKAVIGIRDVSGAQWQAHDLSRVQTLLGTVRPENVGDQELPQLSEHDVEEQVQWTMDGATGWHAMNWHVAHQPTVERWWSRSAPAILSRLAVSRDSWGSKVIPLRSGRFHEVKRAHELAANPSAVIPPTESGWLEFLEVAPHTGERWSYLKEVALFWWQRSIPQTLLSAAEPSQMAA